MLKYVCVGIHIHICIYTLFFVQLPSHVQLFATPWMAARRASLSFTSPRSLLKLISIEPMMPSNHLILCCPFLLLPSVFPSFGVFFSKSALHIRWPEYWSFSFSVSPSNEYSCIYRYIHMNIHHIYTHMRITGSSFY